MSAETLIRRFYDDLWNAQLYDLADEILAPDIGFRGSLGTEEYGIPGFIRYARAVHASLSEYTCVMQQLGRLFLCIYTIA